MKRGNGCIRKEGGFGHVRRDMLRSWTECVVTKASAWVHV